MLKKFFQDTKEDSIKTLAIQKHLKSLLRQRQVLSLNSQQENIQHSVRIQIIDEQKQELLLKQFNPCTADAFQEGDRLTARCYVQGQGLSFNCGYLQLEENTQGVYHRVSFPQRIDIHQRRNAFRVSIPKQHIHSISFRHEEIQLARGHLVDISLSGIQAQFPPSVCVKIGSKIEGCKLQLLDGTPISCDLEVRHSYRDSEANCTRIGARFMELEPSNERQLSKFVASLQRNLCRHGRFAQ